MCQTLIRTLWRRSVIWSRPYLSIWETFLFSYPCRESSDKNNDRAYIEQNLIALLSNFCKPLDPPSCEWLGLSSQKREIRKSGLWNVNHVEQRFDPNYLGVLDYYVSLTMGAKEAPRKQLAPIDWLARTRDDSRQLTLL